VLRKYHGEHLRTPDLALELPTGSGKTLPALLIAEWRRTSLGQRVVYACLTTQLANQVYGAALREGISAVALHGRAVEWDTADAAKYDRSDAVAISTYSTIFNSNPKLTIPGTLIFDDAHAGEQFVAQAWSVAVSRADEPEPYRALLDAIRPELSALLVRRLESTDPDPKTRSDVGLLPISAMQGRVPHIDAVLAAQQGNMKFRYTQIRSHLDKCLLYFGWDGFLIRPYLPPTNFHEHFSTPEQRIYVSATLGDGGELERAFGRSPITRLPIPAGWDQRASGRRFFVFPELIRGDVARQLTRSVIKRARKGLLLTPSNRQLAAACANLVPDGFEVFGKGEIEQSLDEFARADSGVLALANRYDGIDLADDSCRVTVLDGLPTGTHLQERFLIGSLRAGRVLDERLRTRVIQGAGRCTRGLKDYSVVVIVGDELTRFFQRTEVRNALRQETQAEIAFGIENSTVEPSGLLDLVTSCLEQDEDWQEEAEPIIADMRREAIRSEPAGTGSLAASVDGEVRAWDQVWSGDLEAASETAVEVAQILTDGVLAPYRAFWLYLAASWRAITAGDLEDPVLAASATNLLKRAHAAAKGTSWLRELAPLKLGEQEVDPLDEVAVASAANHLARKMSGTKWLEKSEQMLSGLRSTDPKEFEPALTTLGQLLGAEAFKPAEKGRADSVWIFGDMWWLTLEAKSDAKAEGAVSMENVRQTNTQLDSLRGDRRRDAPDGSLSVIITPKQVVDPDALQIALPHVCMVGPEDVVSLGSDAVAAWRSIRLSGTDLTGPEAESLIRGLFAEYRVLPTDIKERIAGRPLVS
jgi:hypothetical protein